MLNIQSVTIHLMQEGLELDTVILPPVEKKADGTVLFGRNPADTALFLRGYLGI